MRVASRALDHLEEWLIATLIGAATALIFVAVLHRYSTGASIDLAKWLTLHNVPVLPAILTAIYSWLAGLDLSWAQELCIYMFIWMAKFGAAYGVRTGMAAPSSARCTPPASNRTTSNGRCGSST